VRGLVLGGACELMMHCARTVAAFETYIGLVEVGVGILPAGAGSKEMALRASKDAKGSDPFPFLQNYFKNIGMASVSNNAIQAKSLGYLKESDVILMHPQEILYVAKQQVLALNIANYYPPRPEKIIAQGKSGWATLQVGLINMKEGGFISEHDYDIGCHIARVMCGGDVEGGTKVPEEWLLALEHQAFMTLLNTKKTQDRIAYMLENGKALRN
jgi:3-hydroxyacyl-CoA dehydrogenase